MNVIHTTVRPNPVPARALPPLPASERRERAFGVGYGNSSGYASKRSYAPRSVATRFRLA